MPARNLSPKTRFNYRHDLLDLLAFLTDRGASSLSDISLRHLEAYQAEMDRRGDSASTRNRKTHSIKSLFHFLTEAGITGASVHTLRHTMATHHVARGTDLKTVQETLGHADLKTTYLRLAGQDRPAQSLAGARAVMG